MPPEDITGAGIVPAQTIEPVAQAAEPSGTEEHSPAPAADVSPAATAAVPEPVAGEEAVVEADAGGEQKPADATTLLGKELAEGEKPPEPAVPEPGKEAAPPEPAAIVEPIAYDIKLPEGIEVDAPQMEALKTVLSDARVAPEVAQSLVDMHVGAMQRYSEHVLSEQHRVWNETQRDWVNEVMGDPVLGGAGFKTAMASIGKVRDMLVPAEEQAAFMSFLEYTGAGNNPAFLRMMHRAAAALEEQPNYVPPAPRPTPDRGGSGKRSGLRVHYDHPSSNKNRGS